MLTQFTAAFDDCFVYRFTKDFKSKEKINVRYVMGPKERVLYDIVNQSKNLSLPVISLEQTSIKRDSSRIQFKDQKIIRPHINDNYISKIPSPIPVTMDIKVSIVAIYKEDIDQIVSNFIPWCNPYFIISWKIPEDFGLDFIEELRSEVTWGGSVDYENPINIAAQDKYRIVGNTSFTIKGWIFPALEAPQAPIYVVNNNFITVPSSTSLNANDDYLALSSNDITDVINISAYPEFTNTFYSGLPVRTSFTINKNQSNTFTFYGKRYNFNNSWYLSGQKVADLQLQPIVTAKFPIISAYKLPEEFITIVNDNIAVVSLSSNYLSSGSFTFVTSNSAGWESLSDIVITSN